MDTNHHPSHGRVDYERKDADPKLILRFAIILIIVAAAVHGLMWGMFQILDAERARKDPQLSPLAPKAGEPPPEPRLQATQQPAEVERPFAPLNLGQAEYAKEVQQLQSYGWVDQDNGVVHIPIDHAKKLILERGLPAREMEE